MNRDHYEIMIVRVIDNERTTVRIPLQMVALASAAVTVACITYDEFDHETVTVTPLVVDEGLR